MLGTPWPKIFSWVRGVVDAVADQQRRGFAGRARDRQDRAGDDPARGAGRITPSTAAPAADAERVRGLAQAVWDEQQHLLARARDQRQHHDRQRDRAREPDSGPWRPRSGRRRTADDDRRQALHQVEHQLERSRRCETGDRRTRSGRAPSGPRSGPRSARRRRRSRGADERVRDPAAGAPRIVGQEAQAQRRRAPTRDAYTTTASIATASSADAVAPMSTTRLTSARRRRLPEAVSGAVGSGSDGSARACRQTPRHRASARWTSKRPAIVRAATLVTRLIASRISAR